jgi:uncharacterized membrane protein YhhN
MKKSHFILYLLICLTVVEAYAEFAGNKVLMFYTKPLLLPMIMLYAFVVINHRWNKALKFLLVALFFSWIGDVSLMLTPEHPLDNSLMGVPKSKYFFLLGLSSFLINHLFLISIYRKVTTENGESLFQQNKFSFLPFLAYGIVMVSVVVPPVYDNPEKSLATIPVILYAAILLSMAAFAYNRYGFVNTKNFWLVFIGAVLFVFSDSIIALNFLAFPGLIPKPGFVIMTTYVAAEFLIAKGILLQFFEEK